MGRFQNLLLCSALSLVLVACSDKNEGLDIGSRDDIIVMNKGMPEMPAPKPVTEIEVDAPVGEAVAEEESAEVEPIEAEEEVKAEVKTQTPPIEMKKVEVKEPAKEVAEMKATPQVDDAQEEVDIIWAEKKEETSPPKMPEPLGDVPPNAKPGECYAKVLIPAVTKNYQERVLISEEQKVLARIVPAKYEVQTEKVLVKEARQYWKKGTGPVQKLDQATGEIMCLVEEPAEYKVVEKRVLIEPEKPEYKMVPAQYETVTKTDIIEPERLQWQRILCETNMGEQPVSRIQQALKNKGYDINVDGKFGSATLNALTDYQTKNGLATRGITYETLDHLGVKLVGA